MQTRFYLSLIMSVLLAACGIHAGGMANSHGMTMATPNMQATAVITQGAIRIIDPWARPSTKADNSASYLVIQNSGAADTLIGVRGTVATSIELHMVENTNGMMKMKPVDGGIAIPANAIQTLQPGGFHIMMIGLTRDLHAGDTFTLTLTFTNAGAITVPVPVR